jgi:hypothetical protein
MTPPNPHDGSCERVIVNCVALARIEPEVQSALFRIDKLEVKMDTNSTVLAKISVKVAFMSFLGSILATGIFQVLFKLI